MNIQADEIIFSRDNVTISKALVKIGSGTYSVANIGSVFIIDPLRRNYLQNAIAFAFISVIIFFIFGVSIEGVLFSTLALVCVIAANGAPFKLCLRTASGDQPILENRDRSYLQDVKSAIEQALVRRT